jgi:hypothetical protein
MTIASEFHDWSVHPSEDARRTKDGSPALKHVRDYHLQRWGGVSLSVPSLYQPRPVDGGTKPSAHAGCAVDIRWQDPGPGRDIVVREMLPFYIGNSQELHVQAIHDYVGCRVWRANRSHDDAGGWRTQDVGSHGGKMGMSWAQWLHFEINASGWHDDRPVESMLGVGGGEEEISVLDFPPTDLLNGLWGLFPLNQKKPHTKIGDKGDYVMYPQCVIFHKAGGAIQRDGDFGQQTLTRVMDLQRFFDLPVHGEIDSVTWDVIDFLATQT